MIAIKIIIYLQKYLLAAITSDTQARCCEMIALSIKASHAMNKHILTNKLIQQR